VGELIATIAAHAVLGIALALVVWALGSGWLRLARRPEPAFAYALGLLVTFFAAWLVLVSPWLAPLSLLLLAPALLGLSVPYRPLLRAAPFALGLGVALGALLHGPTDEESSHAYGDMLFYAAKLVSARDSVLPFRDLLVEGESSTYVEAGSTFLGAALPGIDTVLLQAATMPAFLVAALAPGFAAFGARVSGRQAAALAPLAVAVVAYPTWITESPPVALALPLAFPLYQLGTRTSTFAGIAAGVIVLGPAFALTKGFGAVLLAVAAGVALRRAHLGRRELLVYGAPALAVAAAAIAYFVATSAWLVDVIELKFLPVDALDGLLDQLDRRDTQAASPALLVLGQLLLGAALLRARAWPQSVTLGVALAGSWIVGGHGFDIAVGIAVVFALVRFATRPEQLPVVVIAGTALALSCVFRDISGVRAGFVFGVLLGGGVLAALVPVRQVVVVAAAVAVGVAAGYARGSLAQGPPTLTPEHYDVWRRVEERVGRDDLVFTSETGPALGDSTEGWNYYPGVSGRQVYLAGWSSSPLLVDERERARRLRLNGAVLSRRREPEAIAPGYDRYFAVVRRGDGYALYEIP
jgi:hypothetical protein